jgi:hypothetical protein
MKIRNKIEMHISCTVQLFHKLYGFQGDGASDGFYAFCMQQENRHAGIVTFFEHFLCFWILRFLTAMTLKSSVLV